MCFFQFFVINLISLLIFFILSSITWPRVWLLMVYYNRIDLTAWVGNVISSGAQAFVISDSESTRQLCKDFGSLVWKVSGQEAVAVTRHGRRAALNYIFVLTYRRVNTFNACAERISGNLFEKSYLYRAASYIIKVQRRCNNSGIHWLIQI